MMMSVFQIILLVVVALILVGLFAYLIRIVPQAKAYVVERLGAYHTTWNTGIHILVPFVDRVSNKVTLKEVVKDFAPQPVITKDNVTMQIDTVVYFQITDPKLYTYGVVGPITAIENLTATTLRNIIGDLELDETLTSRDIINTKMRAILDEATDPWGIKVNRVEVKNIIPPRDIQEAMEKQMRAERDKRAQVLTAEGQKEAMIRESEGRMTESVNHAEGEKKAQILAAEADARATILRAEAEAEAIERITSAVASTGSNPTQYLIAMRYLDTLEKIGRNSSDKTLFLPYEATGILSALGGIKEVSASEVGNLLTKVGKH